MNNKQTHPIKKLREKYSLTQGELGTLINQSGNIVAQIEGGYLDIPEQTFYNICERFNIEPQKLKDELKNYWGKQKKLLLERVGTPA